MKALEIDESNATAHNALGDVKKGYGWDFPAAWWSTGAPCL